MKVAANQIIMPRFLTCSLPSIYSYHLMRCRMLQFVFPVLFMSQKLELHCCHWTSYYLYLHIIYLFYLYIYFILATFSEELWLVNGQVEDSTVGDIFHQLNVTEHGSPPSLIIRDRELVSVLEVRIEPGDLNQRPLTPHSVILPTLPRA